MPGRSTVRRSEPPSQANFGLLERFTKHRRLNAPVASQLARDPETLQLAKRIGNCADTLRLNIEVPQDGDPEARLKAARLCNARLCPFCEWRRTKGWRRRLIGGLEQLHADHPKYRALFLTLTVKNVPLSELRGQLQAMQEGWSRMRKGRWFPTDYWFRRTEITVGAAPALELNNWSPYMAHPHFHVLLLVPPSYFSHGYVKQTEWQKQWQMAMRLDYAPVIDVRVAKAKRLDADLPLDAAKAAAIEAAKYASKQTQLLELGDQLAEFHRQTTNVRYYQTSSGLRKYVSQGELTEEELMDDSNPNPNGDLDQLLATAQWFEDTKEYLFTSL